MTNIYPAPDTISIASATRPTLSVYDGTTLVGQLIRRGGKFEAFDIDGVSYGVHDSMQAAAFSLPGRNAS
jgi:hypothetical protein